MSLDERNPGIVTVEKAAWAVVGLLAAGLRLFQLGLRPLSEQEAVQALAAFRFSAPIGGVASVAPSGTSPALFSGNVFSFTLLGASDVTARWLPVLAGLVLVLLPYGLRHRLGRGGALAASLLLAVSPSAVFFSRALDGAILVAACSLAMAVGLIRFVDTHRPAGLYLAAGALGLGLCTGPAFFTFLLILAAFLLGLYALDKWAKRDGGWSSVRVAWSALREDRGLAGRTALVLGAVCGLVATTFVLHPAGVGQVADLIAAWLTGFLPQAGGQPALYPLILLLRYEPLILVLGLVEVAWALLGRRKTDEWQNPMLGSPTPQATPFPHRALLIFWAGMAGILVLAAGHRPAGNILLPVVPLALLAGQGVERACRWIGRRRLWTEAGVVAGIALGLGIFLYLQLTAYSLSDPAATLTLVGITVPSSTVDLLLAALAVILLVGLGVIVWSVRRWRGPESLLAGGWLALVVALGLFTLKSTWSLNVAHAADPREIMIEHATAPDVRDFVDEMEALSMAQSGDAHTLPVTVHALTGPVVSWYLRDFGQQRVVDTLSAPPNTGAAVTLAQQDLPIGESFRGRGFPLRTHWQPWGLGSRQFVQWLLLGGGSLPIVDQEVVVWVEVK